MTTATLAPKGRKKQTLTGTSQVTVQRATAQIPNFDDLPDSAMARQSQLIRDPKHPTRPSPLPFSAATLWRKVRDGEFPAPVKLGPAISAWRVGDVRQWLQAQHQQKPQVNQPQTNAQQAQAATEKVAPKPI